MDVNEILKELGLDLTNPEVKRGAMEAIDAILSSRIPPASLGGLDGGIGMSGEMDVELDPDLIQPSQKHQPQDTPNDIEIEDEDNILDSIKQNDSEETFDNNTSGNNETDIDEPSGHSSSNDTEDSDFYDSENEEQDNDSSDTEQNSNEKADDADDSDNSSEENDADIESDNEDGDDISKQSPDVDSEEGRPGETEDNNSGDKTDEDEEDEKDEEDEYDFDEDDLLDGDIKGLYDDKDLTAKHEARKIKRERTLLAAKKALDGAIARKVSPSLIRELEKSIEALEELQEAVSKNIKDLSDDEFDLMINRVLDAIDSVGNSELTVKSAEEKALQAQEIKADIESSKTQAELSAEDVAKIRAETQAIKAREKETDKYKRRAASSFKGFQDFLNSLYRAVALQVKVNEVQDDSWSAISRRNSGVGVLKQGKKINDLPDNKIPIIDFYFDCSGSWGQDDIKIGKKAVEALAEMEEKGQIKINLYYFGDKVSTSPDETGGGTTGWNEIVKNVIATQATNVIIMTDEDMESWWAGGGDPLKYTVPGYVWYLWKNGENAPRLPRDLKGRGGTQQFSFSRSDL